MIDLGASGNSNKVSCGLFMCQHREQEVVIGPAKLGNVSALCLPIFFCAPKKHTKDRKEQQRCSLMIEEAMVSDLINLALDVLISLS